MNDSTEHPIAIIGAGPAGLAAAAHLSERGLPFIVLEAGTDVGEHIKQWGHVKMFSTWKFNMDSASVRLLEETDWSPPAEKRLPTGSELVQEYLVPLANHPALAPHLYLNTRVVAVGRRDTDKVKTDDREALPFALHLDNGNVIEARAVIDASGTWASPNPMGAGGVPVAGEKEYQANISYGIPDVRGGKRSRYANRRTVVVGSGHSAMNVVLDLLALAKEEPNTAITWIMRRTDLATVFGGGDADALPARGALGRRARAGVESNQLKLLSPFRIRSVSETPTGLLVTGSMEGVDHTTETDEIIVTTGFRPDTDILREVRLSLDPALECVASLAPLIDPNVHSCGTVRPHGAAELKHEEKDFFILGMKSYGRAPTFLLATGYEQARSVAAHLAGDAEAAARVELDLPATGVCSGPTDAAETTATETTVSDCCGGPAADDVDACCVQDAELKEAEAKEAGKPEAGESGCGCGSEGPAEEAESALVLAGSSNQTQPGNTGGGGCC